jgi:hypothetical protein
MYSQGCPIDANPFFGQNKKLKCSQQIFPMKGFSFNTLKNIGCKRQECGVLETAIYHMQGMTQILQWNHSIMDLKRILYSSRELTLTGRRMDWLT